MQATVRPLCAATLGVLLALLAASCGSSGKGLIPSVDAGPLQADFEQVAQAASGGNGNCGATESALGKTEQDFLALPASVDHGLHSRLAEGISNLRKQALATCIQGSASTTATTTPSVSTSTSTTPATTETTQTTTTQTSTTPPTTSPTTPTTTPSGPSGGTEASGEEAEKGLGKDEGHGEGKSENEGGNGASVGGSSPGGN